MGGIADFFRGLFCSCDGNSEKQNKNETMMESLDLATSDPTANSGNPDGGIKNVTDSSLKTVESLDLATNKILGQVQPLFEKPPNHRNAAKSDDGIKGPIAPPVTPTADATGGLPAAPNEPKPPPNAEDAGKEKKEPNTEKKETKTEENKATNKVEEKNPENVTKEVVKEDNQPAAASDVTKNQQPNVNPPGSKEETKDRPPQATGSEKEKKVEEGKGDAPKMWK